MWILSRKALRAMAQLFSGGTPPAGTTVDGSFIALLKAPFAYTADSADSIVFANEADYSGYVMQASGCDTPAFIGQGGFSLVKGNELLWTPSDTTTLNTIYGQALIGSDSVTVVGVELFNAGIPQTVALNSFVTTTIVGPGPNSLGYGSSIVST